MSDVALVILDIGGTIVEDRGEVPDALLSALNDQGLAVSPEDIKQFRGASKQELIRALVAQRRGTEAPENATTSMEIFAGFQRSLERAYSNGGVKSIAGVPAAISWLHERGIAVAANTGFSRRITDLVLARAGLAGLFDAVVTSDDVPKGRPAPFLIFRAMERTGITDVRKVVNVGDTPLDLEAGCNSGVAGVVGVLTGVYAAEELRRHSPTHIIPSVAALPELIDGHRKPAH